MNVALTDNRKARVPYDDLREWIVEADKLGELVRANGYSWQEDIGMAAELLQHDANAPGGAVRRHSRVSERLPGAHQLLRRPNGRT